MYKKEPLPQEKHTNEELYRRQVETLKLFLSKHAITQVQFEKSYRDLTEKMHMNYIGYLSQETETSIRSFCQTFGSD